MKWISLVTSLLSIHNVDAHDECFIIQLSFYFSNINEMTVPP